LAKLCSEIVETKHIEVADELKKKWFEKREIIGVTGGASTPDWIIHEVIKSIENEF
jgi:4-hydroxy-3-methylbut-2-enyl diphosphate reductase